MFAQITIDAAIWTDAITTLGPFLGVAALLGLWQIVVVKKFENRKVRTWMLCGSSVLIIAACTVALVVGFINSNGAG